MYVWSPLLWLVKPAKFILMSSVSVSHPGGFDRRRGMFEKALVWILRGVVPPANDNQRAADFFLDNIGTSNPFMQWAVVRPDTLLEGSLPTKPTWRMLRTSCVSW
jgi:hypothetical protein